MRFNDIQITIVGLGYVGLPLAVEFGKKFPTIGFDINIDRIRELQNGYDRTKELSSKDLESADKLAFSSSLVTDEIKPGRQNVYIITVPTPIDSFKRPDLKYLLAASQSVGRVLSKGDVVIYESTVYPGCTEEDCVPVLEGYSNLRYNQDFYCGYSPERINPGDKLHTLTKIKKVTAGSTPEIADFVDKLYATIIEAGTFKAASIKVAEAAKLIENCQRDINIAFMNELALIFDKMELDTLSVLEAAGTKWNFLPFRPGLVGGHCIGVNPYYLAYKAEALGYHPQVILAGRKINDYMGKHVAVETVKLLIKNNVIVSKAKVLILGITFKENCPDIRDTRVLDVINELTDYGISTDVFDPWAVADEVKAAYAIELKEDLNFKDYDGIILAVNHYQFNECVIQNSLRDFTGVIYDVKGQLDKEIIDKRL